MRPYLTLAIFILFAVGSYWLLQDETKETIADKKADNHFPDYFMENFSITSMNAEGQAEYVLKAKKMLHFDDDDSAELEQPFIEITQAKNNSHITLQASQATYFKRKNIIHLRDNVIIHRAASKTQSELFIYTDYLKMNTLTRIAQTDLAATVKTPEAELNSIGLKLDGNRGTLILKSKVKGTYEATH